MIDTRDRREGHHRVAVLTDVGGESVARVLADGIDAVVATHAVAADVVVIEVCRHPCVCCVTVVAGIASVDMCSGLALHNNVVVTT